MMLDRLEMSGGKVVAEEPLLVDQKAGFAMFALGPKARSMSSPTQAKLLRISP